ncbi:MAG: MgtC/SapB family protein [Clostridia bacterium]|nr:MgtC/SapB family protein [Clostridia bacterium]
MNTMLIAEMSMLGEICLRLVMAVLLGGLIGWERAGTNHDAGLRTHIIVCLGSATIMVVSELAVLRFGIPSELLRMGAQIISGIGFLGAGSILIDGNRIRGITTAAGIWTTACIGIAIGAGCYIVAGVVVLLLLFAMIALRSVSSKLHLHGNQFSIKFTLEDKVAMKNVLTLLTEMNVSVKQIKTVTDDDNFIAMNLNVVLPMGKEIGEVMIALSTCEGVSSLRFA